MTLTRYVLARPDTNDKNSKGCILEFTDYAIVADAIPPQLAERASRCFAESTRILQS